MAGVGGKNILLSGGMRFVTISGITLFRLSFYVL